MAKFCNACGTQTDDMMRFCPACGAAFDDAAPVEAAATPDLTGTLVKKDNKKTFWLAAIVAQILCVILFLLPTVKFTVTMPSYMGDALDSIADLADVIDAEGTESYDVELMDYYDYDYDDYDDYYDYYDDYDDYDDYSPAIGGSSSGSSEELVKGNFSMLNTVDLFGTEAYHIIMLIGVIIALAMMIAPIVKKAELKAKAALVMLAAQGTFFIVNIITLFIIKGKPVALVKRFIKMIQIDGVSSSMVDSACDMLKDFYKFGFSIWGWIYVAVSVVAIALLTKIVLDNKDELFGKFRKNEEVVAQPEIAE